MTNELQPARAIAGVFDSRWKKIAERAYKCHGRFGVHRDLPGSQYGRPVTWRVWSFRNPRATKYDRLLLLSRPSADGNAVSQVVPLQHATGYAGAPLGALPAIDPATGSWAKLWRITWTDGTFDVIAAHSRVRAKWLAKQSRGEMGTNRIERAWL